MSLLRHFPPVHAHIPLGALGSTAASLLGSDASTSIAAATARLARLYPGRSVLLTNSGTSALTLALRATAGSAPPGEPLVALPAYACPDLGSAAIGASFRMVLYDVSPTTLSPDLSSLERCLRAGATHVVAAHLFGRLVDVAEIARLALPFGAVVIEDAAQHAGGTLRGQRGGALADWSILSFGRGKGINAGGGGALLGPAGDESIAAPLAASSRGNAAKIVVSAAFAEVLSHPGWYGIPAAIPALKIGATEYHVPDAPRSISLASARLLMVALDREASDLKTRREVERQYDVALTTSAISFALAPDEESGALRYPVRLRQVTREMARLGVVRSYPRTLAEYPEIAARQIASTERLTGARELAESLHTLPTHRLLTSRERARLIALLLDHEG